MTPTLTRGCVTCGRAVPDRHRDCPACRAHRRRYGAARPPYPAVYVRGPAPCVRCGRTTPPSQRAQGRCARCRSYWARHGVEHPATICTNCRGVRQGGGWRGRCQTCAVWYGRHGTERPTAPAVCRVCGQPRPTRRRDVQEVRVHHACYLREWRQRQRAQGEATG